MRFRFLLVAILLLLFPSMCEASIRVDAKDCLPFFVSGFSFSAPDSERELASIEAVSYEVYHLESVLPGLSKVDWPLYVVSQKCCQGNTEIAGIASSGMQAAIFASRANAGWIWAVEEVEETGWWPPSEDEAKEILRWQGKPATAEAVRAVQREDRFRRWETRRVKVARTASAAPYLSAYVAAHEVGHLVRFGFLSESDLREYLRLRGLENMERKSCFRDDPEEVFAEDFRWLFGTEKANQVEYEPSCPEPGKKEKRWILKKLEVFD